MELTTQGKERYAVALTLRKYKNNSEYLYTKLHIVFSDSKEEALGKVILSDSDIQAGFSLIGKVILNIENPAQ